VVRNWDFERAQRHKNQRGESVAPKRHKIDSPPMQCHRNARNKRAKQMPDPTAPLSYMARTRAYYLALGYDNPFQWAHFDDVPFTPLPKPLDQCRVAIVTTAAPYQPDKGDQGPGAPYNADAKFYEVYALPADPPPDLRISHIAIDRAHTTAEDSGSYLPLRALASAAQQGRIAEAAPRVFGLPTNRSISATLRDAGVVLALCKADMIDAVILVPNCPVCHQSVSITSRVLEEQGVPTVIMGCARDIVENVGVARFMFSDFPLGNSAGRPNDPESQRQTLDLALDLLAGAPAPRTTRVSPLGWSGAADWKRDYSNPDLLSAEELAARRAAFDRGKEAAKRLREAKA